MEVEVHSPPGSGRVPRLARRLVALAGLGVIAAGCGGAPSNEAQPPAATVPAATPHDATHHHGPAAAPPTDVPPRNLKHGQLLEMARRLRNSTENYFGERTLRELEEVDTSAMTGEELSAHEYQMAWQSYKLGRLDDAVRLFQSSFDRVPNLMSDYLLGLAQLQTGVRDNCIGLHNSESCVFPLRGGGVHREKSGSEQALLTFLSTLEHAPREEWPKVRWMANIAAMASGQYPGQPPEPAVIPPEKLESAYDIGRFRDVGIDVGVGRMNLAGGSVLEDFDGDGFLDIVTSTCDLFGQLLYFHNNGDGSFTEWTERANLLGQIGGLNLIHADYDGDGHRDLLVLRGGWMGTYGRFPNSLLRNRGDGTFDDVTDDAGLGESHYPSQTAGFADYDLDGDLDLFCGNEMPPPASKQDYPCQLFRNEGDGTFTDVTERAGVQNRRLTKGMAWGDVDGDRYPDLYVSNQYAPNRLYHNEGDGTFTDATEEWGVAEPVYSFPTWFWDYDNDGRLDLFVAAYGGDMNTFVRSFLRPSDKFGLDALYHRVDGGFEDVAKPAGLTLQTLTMGANYGDLDNDGWLDFYLGTGAPEFDVLQPNAMWRNDGRGGFQNVTFSGGFGQIRKGHGIAWGDVDNDGDQDIYLQSGGIYPYDGYFNSLFENPGHGNRWLTLSLVGVESNRDAFGSRIRVRVEENGKPRDIYRWVWPNGSFGSSSLQQEIGLGKATRVISVDVHWPKTDVTQHLDGFELDSFYRITEGEAALEPKRFACPG